MKFFHIVPKTFFQSRLGDILGMSWGRPELTFQGRPLNVRLGCPVELRLGRPQDVRSEHPRDVSSGRPLDGQIESLGDVLGTLDGGTSSGRPGD